MWMRGVWFGRGAAVAIGVILAACSVSSASAWMEYPQPDLSKKPQMEHIMNQDFGTKGVKVRLQVLDYDAFADSPWKSETGSVYTEARVQTQVSGFRGPVTVWARSLGSAYQENTSRSWQKVVAQPKNGKAFVVIPVADKFHCAKLTVRANDGVGRWTKAFAAVRVRDTPEPHDSDGGSISW